MAELSDDQGDRILATFLPAYNDVHKAAYAFKESEPDDHPACDYLCEDPGRVEEPLKVPYRQDQNVSG